MVSVPDVRPYNLSGPLHLTRRTADSWPILGFMSTWVVMAVIVGVPVLVAVLRIALRGKADRAARRELRRLRWKERGPNTYGAAELRRNMTMDRMPGKGTTPGGP
jgi:hypothetical protein